MDERWTEKQQFNSGRRMKETQRIGVHKRRSTDREVDEVRPFCSTRTRLGARDELITTRVMTGLWPCIREKVHRPRNFKQGCVGVM
jgi:hypothetical protein